MKSPLDQSPTTVPVSQFNALVQEKAHSKPGEKPSTFGLKLMDGLIYGTSNFVVIGGSVLLTYLTTNAGKIHADQTVNSHPAWSAFCNFAHNRGIAFENEITKGNVAEVLGKVGVHVDEKSAKAWKMVAFSFLDGTFFTIPVWFAEKIRIPLARKIDEAAGTVPDDLSVYENPKEKQSIASLLGARVATLSVVLPVAVTLGKVGTIGEGAQKEWLWKTEKTIEEFSSLNDKLFHNPGIAFGNWLTKKTPAGTLIEKSGVVAEELFKTLAFETFYTSVCTGSFYELSRVIAAIRGKEKENNDVSIPDAVSSADLDRIYKNAPQESKVSAYLPDKQLHDVVHEQRLEQNRSMVLNPV